MKWVFLTGLDGTGLLFEPLIQQMKDNFEHQFIALNNTEALDEIEFLIGNQMIILIAESYAGGIANALVARANLNIYHLVFVASFLKTPTKLIHLTILIPFSLIQKTWFPSRLLGVIAFARHQNKAINKLLKEALIECGEKRLKRRIKKIGQLNKAVKTSTLPCTYLQPSFDLFVNKSAVNHLKSIFTSMGIIKISGSHFLLQTNPKQCWQEIKQLAEAAPAN